MIDAFVVELSKLWQFVGAFVVSLVVLLFDSLGVVCLSVLGVVRFSIWFPYKLDHFPSS
jgi:hypothetical protein